MLFRSVSQSRYEKREREKALADIQTKIDSFENIETLEKWYSGSKKLQDSVMKEDILKMIEARKKALQPKPEKPKAPSRTEIINKIVAATNEHIADVNSYVSDQMLTDDDTSRFLNEIVLGNADAITQFKRDLHEYLNAVNGQPETESTTATNGVYIAAGTLDSNYTTLAANDVIHFRVNEAASGSTLLS